MAVDSIVPWAACIRVDFRPGHFFFHNAHRPCDVTVGQSLITLSRGNFSMILQSATLSQQLGPTSNSGRVVGNHDDQLRTQHRSLR
jgi:hypothetical protein